MNKTPLVGDHYQHYKGSFYQIIAIALDCETKEELVVYKSLEDSSDFPQNTHWVRSLSMFTEELCVNDSKIARFKKVNFK